MDLKQICILSISIILSPLALAQSAGMTVSIVRQGDVAHGCEPDLLITAPIIPMVISKGGNIVYIYDEVTNSGGSVAPASTTRYYISNKQPVTYTSENVLGERRIKALAPKEAARSSGITFTLPEGLPQGKFYLASCVDADNEVEEIREDNNCVNSGQNRVVYLSEPPESCLQTSAQATTMLLPFAYDGFEPGIHRSISRGDARERLIERFGPALRRNEKIIPGVHPELNEKIETWYYDGLEIELSSTVNSDNRGIKRILLTSGEFKLKGGISIGSSRNEVISILGDPDLNAGYILTDPLKYKVDYHNIESSTDRKSSVYSHIEVNIKLDAHSRVEKILWNNSQEYSTLQ